MSSSLLSRLILSLSSLRVQTSTNDLLSVSLFLSPYGLIFPKPHNIISPFHAHRRNDNPKKKKNRKTTMDSSSNSSSTTTTTSPHDHHQNWLAFSLSNLHSHPSHHHLSLFQTAFNPNHPGSYFIKLTLIIIIIILYITVIIIIIIFLYFLIQLQVLILLLG